MPFAHGMTVANPTPDCVKEPESVGSLLGTLVRSKEPGRALIAIRRSSLLLRQVRNCGFVSIERWHELPQGGEAAMMKITREGRQWLREEQDRRSGSQVGMFGGRSPKRRKPASSQGSLFLRYNPSERDVSFDKIRGLVGKRVARWMDLNRGRAIRVIENVSASLSGATRAKLDERYLQAEDAVRTDADDARARIDAASRYGRSLYRDRWMGPDATDHLRRIRALNTLYAEVQALRRDRTQTKPPNGPEYKPEVAVRPSKPKRAKHAVKRKANPQHAYLMLHERVGRFPTDAEPLRVHRKPVRTTSPQGQKVTLHGTVECPRALSEEEALNAYVTPIDGQGRPLHVSLFDWLKTWEGQGKAAQ